MDFNARKKLILKAAARAEHVRTKCRITNIASIDPISVAEQRGCEIRFLSLPSLEGVYSPYPSPTIILGSERPAGRRAYTCMHELGHHEFGHGECFEELKSNSSKISKDPDEFLADMFAATILMSQRSILYALKTREIDIRKIKPIQVFRIASYLGVGYSTLIDHMTLTLKLLSSQQRDHLKKVTPKDIKAHFGCNPQSEVLFADQFWIGRALDMEIGDILVLHNGIIIEDSPYIMYCETIKGQTTFKAVKRGYIRAYHKSNGWALNIRITSKQYVGLAQYRFLDDPEEDT